MTWNYRIATHIFSYKDIKEMEDNEDIRLFSIIEVYYDKDGKIDGYADAVNPTKDWEGYDALLGTIDMFPPAFLKPVLDLDNWPNEYEKENLIPANCKYFDEVQGRNKCTNPFKKQKSCKRVCDKFEKK